MQLNQTEKTVIHVAAYLWAVLATVAIAYLTNEVRETRQLTNNLMDIVVELHLPDDFAPDSRSF